MASGSTLLSPHYGIDLRSLVDQAFGEPEPVPVEPVPWGSIGERIKAPPPAFQPTLVACREAVPQDAQSSEVRITTVDEYWMLALPHRLLILGPLLEIAGLAIGLEERIRAERRLLDLYKESYHCVPLPPSVLAMIRDLATRAPRERLAAWLDAAREEVMTATTMEEATASRRALRLEALRHGAAGSWGDRTVAVAELMADIFALCRAAREDVERASCICDRFDGSISFALQSLDEEADTTFERVLTALLRPALSEDDLGDEERGAILAFSARRSPHWREGLLLTRRTPPPVTIRRVTDRKDHDSHRDEAGETMQSSETAAECYRRILTQLEERIIGRPDLCRRLALVGMAHLNGVTHQRLLVCGPTGSGKSHSARALAEAIGRPFLQVDMADVTATGWKGLDVPDLLNSLARRAGGKLDGAVLQLDEIDKVRIGGKGVEGNSLEAKLNLQASLLALLDGQPVTPDSVGHYQLNTSRLLVIGTGAFSGRFTREPPSTRNLTRWGWMPELAARWGERLVLSPPGRSEAIELLRSSERSVGRRLGPMLEALDIEIEVPEAVLAYVVDCWFRTGADYRSAAEWLLSAARRRLIEALEQGGTHRIVLVPDDIVLPRPSREDRRPFR